MKIIILVLIIIIFDFTFSEAQPILFHKVYHGTPGEVMTGSFECYQTQDQGYLTGNIVTLLRLDSSGNTIWRKHLVDSITLTGFSMRTFSDNFGTNYLAAGSSLISNLDSNLNLLWMKQLGTIDQPSIYSMGKTNNYNHVLCGQITYNGMAIPCIFKIDTIANVIWAKIYKSFYNIEGTESMVITPDNSLIICGTSKSVYNPISYYDCVIFKTDMNGTVQWSKRYTSINASSDAKSIKSTIDGGFVISGRRNLHSFLMKIDSVGNQIWSKSISAGINFLSRDMIITNDNGFVIIGDLTDTISGGTSQSSAIVKLDSQGNLEWSRTLGGFGDVSVSSVLQNLLDEFTIAGRRTSINGDYSIYIIKTDSLGHTNGCLEGNTTVNISNLNDTIINFTIIDSTITASTSMVNYLFPNVGTEFDLCNFQNIVENSNEVNIDFTIQPNPNIGNYKIELINNLNEFICIEIIDIYGLKKYEKFIYDKYNKIEFNVYNFNPGFYLIRVKSPKFSVSKRLIVTQ